MKFRKLYWVTEDVNVDGSSQITGVYTSIPNLLERGIQALNGTGTAYRLSLVKLDSRKGVLHTWAPSDIVRMKSDLTEFVSSGEMSEDDVKQLLQQVGARELSVQSA